MNIFHATRLVGEANNCEVVTLVPFFFFSDLDLSLSPTGKVVKTVGDTLPVKMEKNSSGDAKVSWTKVMGAGVRWLIRNK